MRLLVVATSFLVLIATASPGRAGESRPCDPSTAAPALAGGLRVQVDPETGTYSMPAPAAPTTTSAANARSVSTPLAIEPGSTAAGGYKVRLPDSPTAEER